MAKQTPGELLVDGIGALDAGVNNGLAPQLLAPNQVSMSTNMTFRGGYGTHRPSIREINLNFGGDSVLQALCTQRAFQGACFYQPDTGAQSLVASIGGKLFQFFPNGTTATVLDISVPNDPNPAYPQQAWLWQSERFVIVNDGVSLPIFFDGNTSRRSNGSNKVLATIVGSFVTPSVGANVAITVSVPYTGPTNVPVIVNGKQFTLLSTGSVSTPSATITPYYDPDIAHTSGEAIISYPNRVGTLLQTIPSGTVTPTVALTSNLVDSNNNPIANGTILTIVNEQFIYTFVSQQPGGNINARLTRVSFISGQNSTINTHPAGSLITINSSAPSVTVGTLAADFTVAPLVDIAVAPIFTGAAQVVWIGNGQYFIFPKTPVTTNVITLQNVGGTPGDPMTGDITALPELPPGRMGVYGMGRNWMALTDGFSFIASDIDGGTSGTDVYNFRDAPLRVTENTYLAGGGAFRVPGALGDIRAMRFSATLDSSLGQGPLQVFTTMAAFSCAAPVDRFTWTSITNPILTQALIGAGALSQNGTQLSNGDIIFRAIDGIRSLILARREFDTWGNVPQSREVEPILKQDNPTLVQFESEAVFDNRNLLAILPTNGPLGVFCQGIIALNFDPISNLRGKAPSIYDGLWTGMNVLQLVAGVFNGVERCYAFCYDSVLSLIRLFEIQRTDDAAFDNANTPVTYSFESAALYNNTKIKGQFDLVELLDGEMYLSDIRGVVNVEVWYRPNYSDCWTKWTEFGICGDNTDPTKPTQYRTPIGLGSPSVMDCDPNTKRPTRIGLTFQVRFQFTGSCKFRGARFKASLVPETKYQIAQCKPLCVAVADADQCEPCVSITDCLQFPLVLYNLNANKSYQNDITSVEVTCPDNSIQTVVVPAGTITYTLPFAPGFAGDYPPLVMNCLSGGVIVKTIPSGATQDEIDLIVNEMIAECVQAYAQSIAPCGSDNVPIFYNTVVTTTHTCDVGTLTFTGTVPSWISLDLNTGIITGNAGAVTSNISVSDATTQAQSQLEVWVQSVVDSGALHCVTGPSCVVDTGNSINTIAGTPDGPLDSTYDPATRRLALVDKDDGKVVIIDTANNVVKATITLASSSTDGTLNPSNAFSTSNKRWVFQTDSATATVTDIDGGIIGTMAPPVGGNFASPPHWVYSPEADKWYTFILIGGTQHICEYDPHTLTLTRNVDTGGAGANGIAYYPNNIVLVNFTGFIFATLTNFPISTLITDKNTGNVFTARGRVAYDPVSNRLFVGQSFSNNIVAFNASTFGVDTTITPVTSTGPFQWINYNPVTKAIICLDVFGEVVVIDPATNTILCEILMGGSNDGGGIGIDYSSGDVYFFDEDWVQNPLRIFH
jgi:hypothetical protein